MIIEVKNAEFSYDGRDSVFEQVGFSVEAGEILAILGPNGCGKTTLLNCINGLLRLQRGEVRIEGRKLDSLKRNGIGRKVGYVPQSRALTFPYTVLEMVLMGRAPHLGLFASPSAMDVEIAKEAIETVGMSHLIDRPYSNTSGGEAQLVLIARALTAEPKALLLDEPTSHLDIRNQMLILDILEKLAKERNLTTIMATHFPDQALSVSSKAFLMSNEGINMIGKTEDVLTERNLKDVYGVDMRIISVDGEESNTKAIVPLRKRGASEKKGVLCNG